MSRDLYRGGIFIINACVLGYMLDAPDYVAYIGAFVIAYLVVPEEAK